MKFYIFFFILLFCQLSCSPNVKKIIGEYHNYCILYGKPKLKLVINEDKTFIYEPLYYDKIHGTWLIDNKTLVLNSEYFLRSYQEKEMLKILEELKRDTSLLNFYSSFFPDSYKRNEMLEIFKDLKNDTSLLHSQFPDPDVPIDAIWSLLKPPFYKDTESIEKEVYLIKGKKLFGKDTIGYSKDCYLFKIKSPRN